MLSIANFIGYKYPQRIQTIPQITGEIHYRTDLQRIVSKTFNWL